MGFLKDLAHVAGNMAKVASVWHEVRMIVLRERGVDMEKLPKEVKMQLYDRVKTEYLDGNTSAAQIAKIFL